MKCIIKIKRDDNISKAFEAELNHSKNRRAEYTIKKLKNHLKFVIKAEDVVAMRATVNTILRLLDVYEKGKNGNTKISPGKD